MTPSLMLSLVEGTELVAQEEHTLALRHDGFQLTARRLTPGLVAALRRLAAPGATEAALAELATGTGGEALPRFYQVLHALDRRGMLRRAVQVEGRELASLCAVAAGVVFSSRRLLPGRSYQLSRFAYLRRQGEGAVVESPRSFARAVLHDGRLGALVAALAQPRKGAELGEAAPGLPAAATCLAAELLLNAGFLEELTESGACLEDEDPQVQTWEFHDLLFHARSRLGRRDGAFGGTYRFAGRLPPPSALKPPTSGQTIDLYRPDLERLALEDPPLELVQQQRCSIREYGAEPVTVRQLGEFLFRVGRVKEVRAVEVPLPGGPVAMEFTSRPYPGGGALYELELYVVVNACGGLERGLYHYEPRGHRLERLPAPPAEWEALLGDASSSTGVAAEKLQVELVVAARFQRIAWKYAGMAYAVILKHVGVLYQTMYLAATAMGLAPCGVGGGDSDRFARAAGTNYYAETSVGEFLLGSRP